MSEEAGRVEGTTLGGEGGQGERAKGSGSLEMDSVMFQGIGSEMLFH